MMNLFKLASQRHGAIVKHAIVGSVVGLAAKGIGAAAGYAARNPIKALFGGLTAYGMGTDVARSAGKLSKIKVSPTLPGMTRTF